MEEFRLGVQKCRKTIQNAVQNPAVFKSRGSRVIFKLFRRVSDIRASNDLFSAAKKKAKEMNADPDRMSEFGAVKKPGTSTMSLTGLTGIVGRKKKEKDNAKSTIFKRWGKPIDLL